MSLCLEDQEQAVPQSILKNINMQHAFSGTTEVDTLAQKCASN